MPENEIETVALTRLASDFPDVPMRIIAEVLAGYLRLTTSLTEAIDAAYARIADACAV